MFVAQPKSPTLQADSLPSEPPRKPKDIRVGSLFLLQGIFLTQESNGGVLHCRWILYQLSYREVLAEHYNVKIIYFVSEKNSIFPNSYIFMYFCIQCGNY